MKNKKGFIVPPALNAGLTPIKRELGYITPPPTPRHSNCKNTPSNSAPKGQSKTDSIAESLSSVLLGFWVALLVQVIVFPWFDIVVTIQENFYISFIFTFASIIRSYIVRRLFNMLEVRKVNYGK